MKVTPLADQPGKLALSFSFDATAPCRVSIFLNAKEDPVKRNKLTSPEQPLAVYTCEKGVSDSQEN